MADLLRSVKDAVKQTPLWPLLRPRRVHVYNLGAGRTGTTAITSIFSDTFRVGHEAHVADTVELLSEYWSGSVTEREVRKRVMARDRRWRLEVESSAFLAGLSPILADLFPNARFLVTVRPPREWLRSNIDQCINSPREELPLHFRRLRDLNYGPPPQEYPAQESPLGRYNLHSLHGYLRYWSWHYETVLDSIPQERRLFIRTSRLNEAASKVSDFLGVSAERLSTPSRENETPEHHKVLTEVEQGYLWDLINEHCSNTVARIRQEVD